MPDQYGSPLRDVEPPDYEDLLDLIQHRPAFHADAACREAPPEVSWFIDRGGDPRPAKAVCQRCLVAGECRAWALDQGDALEGIWAALSKRDRAAQRRLAA